MAGKTPKTPKKDPAAVALGRKGGKSRAKALSAEDLSAQGRNAAQARWGKAKKKPAGTAGKGND